jgi:hypothetical protein
MRDTAIKEVLLALARLRVEHADRIDFARREPDFAVCERRYYGVVQAQAFPLQGADHVVVEHIAAPLGDDAVGQFRLDALPVEGHGGSGVRIELVHHPAAEPHRDVDGIRECLVRRRMEVDDRRFQPHRHVRATRDIRRFPESAFRLQSCGLGLVSMHEGRQDVPGIDVVEATRRSAIRGMDGGDGAPLVYDEIGGLDAAEQRQREKSQSNSLGHQGCS